ncbi:MAG: alpha/beta fold hydrolase [Clostridia bacterium]|nr:alpha/beta fold hydrolase [Clostridia bacterium]
MDPEKEKKTENEKKPGRGRRFLKRAAKIAAGTVVVSAVATELVFLIMFGRSKPVEKACFPLEDWAAENGLLWSAVEFISGGNTLRGYIVGPEKPRALMLIAHGMNASSEGWEPVVQYFAERDLAVMLFDGTATGRSEGERVVGLQQARYDIRSAIDFIRSSDDYSSLPVVLLGHSAGAYGAAAEAGDEGVCAAVCVSGFDTPIGTMHRWARTYAHIFGDIQLPFLAAHEYAALGIEANTSASAALTASGTAALVIHGANDDAVPMDISIFGKLEGRADNIECRLEASPGHDNHSDILVTEKDGAVNYPLLGSIYDFLESVLP